MKLTDLYQLPDRDLLAELRIYQAKLAGNEATYGLAAADTTAITNALNAFEADCDDLDTKRAEVAAAREARNETRRIAVETAVPQFKTARTTVGNTSPLLAEINMDAYDTTPTTHEAPASAPFALIDFGILRHTLKFRDASTPDKRGKPAGVLGAEVWSKVGGSPPVGDSDFTMVGLKTSSPMIVDYAMGDAGKKAWYRLRWVSTNGDKGPWGEIAEGTING